MFSRYIRHLLWLPIFFSIAPFASRIQIGIDNKAGAVDWLVLLLLVLYICSPYIFMLIKVPKVPDPHPLHVSYTIFVVLISLPGLLPIHTIHPVAFRIFAISFLPLLQWIAIGLYFVINWFLRRREKAKAI